MKKTTSKTPNPPKTEAFQAKYATKFSFSKKKGSSK